ncbi:transposable element Tc1 transposase [Trichonephila clavipes]|nr:transposable element Tc1 transposase [Trichonephila clavipes]
MNNRGMKMAYLYFRAEPCEMKSNEWYPIDVFLRENETLGNLHGLHVFERGSVTGVRYRDEVLEPYVRPFRGACGPEFILMGDNARPNRALLVDEFLECGYSPYGLAIRVSRPQPCRAGVLNLFFCWVAYVCQPFHAGHIHLLAISRGPQHEV